MMLNQKPMTITLRRIDFCDLLIACLAAYDDSGAEKWIELHRKIRAEIEKFDKQQLTDEGEK